MSDDSVSLLAANESISIVAQFCPSPPPIEEVAWIPEGAVAMTREEICNKIYYLPDSNQILKLGSRVRMAEAEAMRFVATRTSTPVAHVHEAYKRPDIGEENCDGSGYIFVSKIEGHILGTVWKKLSEAEKALVVDQLRGYVHQL